MTGGDLRALYERWLYELWTTADRDLAEDLLTPGFVGHWPDQDVYGPAELVATIGRSLALFTGVTTSIDVGPIVDGPLLAARWTFRGGYAGGLSGAPAVLRGADGSCFAEYWVAPTPRTSRLSLARPEAMGCLCRRWVVARSHGAYGVLGS
jgi:hypothetical protein